MSKKDTTAAVFNPVLVVPELIPIDVILPSPANPRQSKEYDIVSLRESIHAQGLLHPIIVRKAPQDSEKFEIVMGERRWRACQGLWPTIPAVVRELSDADAHEITVVENMQREDLTPLEEAAGIQTLLDAGKDIKDIADRLGKPVGWVLRRAKLQNLSSKWKKSIADEDEYASKLSAGHLELVARFDHDTQDKILDENDLEGDSLKDCREMIERDYMMKMSAAPWKDDAELPPATAGSCQDCSKRTGAQGELFDDFTTKKNKNADCCLDNLCWKQRMVAFITHKAEEMKADNPKLLFVTNGRNLFEQENEITRAAVHHYEVTSAKKTDKDAVPALIIDGPGAGTTGWVKAQHRDGSNSKATMKVGGKKTMAEKKKGLEKRRTIRFDGLVLDELEKIFNDQKRFYAIDVDIEFITNLVTRFGAEELRKNIDDCGYSYRDNNPFGNVKIEGDDYYSLAKCVLPKIRDGLLSDIRAYEPDRAKALKCCEWFGFDDKTMLAAVEEEIPVPKAWQLQEKPATKKATKAVRKCRVCGCTEGDCRKCIEKTGKPCTWVEDDLCSACACDVCKSAHPGCKKCCRVCKKQCNGEQTCRVLPKQARSLKNLIE